MVDNVSPDVKALFASNDDALQSLQWELEVSEGEFSLTLVYCNFSNLGTYVLEKLRETTSVQIRELRVHPTVKALYAAIWEDVQKSPPAALMVFGLDLIHDIDNLLISTNRVREEFRTNLKFPLVLWINEDLLKKLNRLAPDFRSWATTIAFIPPLEVRLALLQEEIYSLFNRILEFGDGGFPRSTILSLQVTSENLAGLLPEIENVETCNPDIEPALAACFQFVRGKIAYANKQIEHARTFYEESLSLFEQEEQQLKTLPSTDGSVNKRRTQLWEQKAGVLFHLGLWWRRYAVTRRSEAKQSFQKAEQYYQQCVQVLEQAGSPKQVAKFIGAVGEVLQRTEKWDELKNIAVIAVELHRAYPDRVRLGYAYGLLAEVASAKSEWKNAEGYAKAAIEANTVENSNLEASIADDPLLPKHSYYESLYRLLLARAERKLNRISEARSNLEAAKNQCDYTYDPLLHIRILKEMQSLLSQQNLPLEAFEIKQKQQSIEYQYGIQPFIGAVPLQPQREVLQAGLVAGGVDSSVRDKELSASGREDHLNQLWARIGQDYYSLIILYGQSGVGKTSLLLAGLVPKLQQNSMGDKDIVPVLLSVYTDWVNELGRKMTAVFNEARPSNVSHTFSRGFSPVAILDQLKKHESQNLLTVLIFDQFADVFTNEQIDKEPFFVFLEKCLVIPNVTVIISIADTDLHSLLELAQHASKATKSLSEAAYTAAEKSAYETLENILQKKHLYYIGNFSHREAEQVIEELTHRSQFKIEPKLIKKLVEDLANKGSNEIRPIELQVVGSQLQKESITTLKEYEDKGPKDKLVRRFLDEVINDCGEQNKEIASIVLFLLTDEGNPRPLRTRAEIVADAYKQELLDGQSPKVAKEDERKVELVLEIFVRSGLVFLMQDFNIKRYQLIHQYLVSFIREDQQEGLKKQIQEARRLLKKASKDKARNVQAGLGAIALLAIIFSIVFFAQTREADLQREEAQKAQVEAEFNSIRALIASANVNLSKGNDFEATLDSLRAASLFIPEPKKNDINFQDELNEKYSIIRLSNLAKLRGALEKAWQPLIYSLREFNRLEDIDGTEINSISVSSDGAVLATGESDGSVKIWHPKSWIGSKTLSRPDKIQNSENVKSVVSLSRDGKLLASSGNDGIIQLWQVQNHRKLQSLHGHTEKVNSVSFSPDNTLLAAASGNGSIQIWRISDREKLRLLPASKASLNSVSFSPDGKLLASGGNDGIIQIWQVQDGRKLWSLRGSAGKVTSVSFSPDGQMIASAGASENLKQDKTVRLWNVKDGKEIIPPLTGHDEDVTSVSFSCDGKMIASASVDETIKLWSINGALLQTLKGHKLSVRSVGFGCDKTRPFIASAGDDKIVRLWQSKNNLFQAIPAKDNLEENASEASISFSPDSKRIVTALKTDNSESIIKLWDTESGQWLGSSNKQPPIINIKISSLGDLASCSRESTGDSGKITINLWKLQGKKIKPLIVRGKEDKPLYKYDGSICKLSFSSDGKLLAFIGKDKRLVLWNLSTGREVTNLWPVNEMSITGLGFSQNGKLFASGTKKDRVELWNFTDGTQVSLPSWYADNSSNPITKISFSPDESNSLLATASEDGTISLWRLWNLNEPLLKAWKREADRSDIDIAFGPRNENFSKTLISSRTPLDSKKDQDGSTFKVWRADGSLLQSINLAKAIGSNGAGDSVIFATVSQDGKKVAVLSQVDETIKILRVEGSGSSETGTFYTLLKNTCDQFINYLKTNPNVRRESDRRLCDYVSLPNRINAVPPPD